MFLHELWKKKGRKRSGKDKNKEKGRRKGERMMVCTSSTKSFSALIGSDVRFGPSSRYGFAGFDPLVMLSKKSTEK